MIRRWSAAVLALLSFSAPAWSDSSFVEMAGAGQWSALLRAAQLRSVQLPLTPDECLIAGHASRIVANREAQEHFLLLASEDPELRQVAMAEIAEMVLEDDPSRALALVLPTLHRADTRALRDNAVEVAERALEVGEVDDQTRARLNAVLPSLRRAQRRRLELALAAGDSDGGRARMASLLKKRTDDLPALAAARALEQREDLSPVERWRIARTLYSHAFYVDAVPILETLAGSKNRSVPAWEVAFIRGRCAFRQERWNDAISWYERALALASRSDDKADLEVHMARCLEFDGRMEEAIAAAQRSVRFKTTDPRRLFLARLRLKNDQPELAAKGVSQVRGRTSRAHGELAIAMDEVRRGEMETGTRGLLKIRRNPWRGPAAVLAADFELAAARFPEALRILDDAATSLDRYWAGRARRIMAGIPVELRDEWRSKLQAELSSVAGSRLNRRIGAWAALEIEENHLQEITQRVAAISGIVANGTTPDFPVGLAARLWAAGLESSAIRWDPGGLPSKGAAESLWTARALDEAGIPWRAISVADAAWRKADSQVPLRAYAMDLRTTSFPLPDEAQVKQAGADHNLPWALLAGVAREESRWNPRVLSRVGARGLMQLMPATAAAVAEAQDLNAPAPSDLFDPGLSLHLGAAELARLLAVFDGRYAPAVAAYNAGETQAKQWLAQCGEHCTEALYALTISFTATRTYTTNVLAAMRNYEVLYPGSPQDHDGGPKGTHR